MRYIKNILITGGSGFIGSNFIKMILNDACSNKFENIINLDKLTYAAANDVDFNINDPRYKFFRGDICDENLVKTILSKFKIDSVVNFAAESHVDNSIENPNEFIQTNILGTFNLLKCVHELNLKKNEKSIFFHVSTDEVFGSLEKDDPGFTENNSYKPNSPYSASKASSDHLVRAWHKTYNLPILITNCSNNFGPNQNTEKLIPKIIKRAINKKSISIYGDGMNIRDWLYVEDHCKAILKVLTEGVIGETYNIGGANEITNIDIANSICEYLDELLPYNIKSLGNLKKQSYKSLITFVKDRPGHDYRYSIDSTKIQKNLNWFPIETFDSGIKKTIAWYLK